uniref:DUF7870 domain-containing protein n=1 Tax=Nelumbo nucifera TaxID=4432 RepID=A0A822Y9W7_NELNU|nr:TPA_asm: hypothetical protein HUJ06_030828 [Nelumbo nucifera]
MKETVIVFWRSLRHGDRNFAQQIRLLLLKISIRKKRVYRGFGVFEVFWPNKRCLCAFPSEAKKAALDGLEDVLLEPPQRAHVESNKYLKRTKFLPDLTGYSLEGYPRRVFVDVGLPERKGGSPGWFEKNYPTRNRDSEIYKIETVSTDELSTDTAVPQLEMPDWLRKNVKEEEYVVMKAEVEVVEELVKNKDICLVDEMFLECKHRGLGRRKKKSWGYLGLFIF